MAPLRHLYTAPSVKILFQQKQCKSSFRKFTVKSIKTYTFQYNKNMIHKISDHALTENEFSLLTKGLSFSPTPTKTFKQEINNSWSKFKTRMLKQYFFQNSVHENHPILRENQNEYPHPLTTSTLDSLFTYVKQELGYRKPRITLH